MGLAIALNFGYFVPMTVSLWRGLQLQNCGCDGVFFARPLRWYCPLEDLLRIVAGAQCVSVDG